MNRITAAAVILLLAACGGEQTDGEGLAEAFSARGQFTRASQLYFRGRLSASLEEFNGVVYRFPDSPFAQDARLAVRRIESDLSTGGVTGNGSPLPDRLNARVAVVGRTAVTASVNRTADLLGSFCPSVTGMADDQSSDLTMLFHAAGYEESASVLADSLDRWLLRPEGIPLRPGDELIETVAAGYDILVIIGTDAVFEPPVP